MTNEEKHRASRMARKLAKREAAARKGKGTSEIKKAETDSTAPKIEDPDTIDEAQGEQSEATPCA